MITDDDLVILGLFLGAIALIVALGLYARRIRQKAGGGVDWFMSAVAGEDLTRDRTPDIARPVAPSTTAPAAAGPRSPQEAGQDLVEGVAAVSWLLAVPAAIAGLILAALLKEWGITTRVVSDPLPVLVGAVIIGAIAGGVPLLLDYVPIINRVPRLIAALVVLTTLITPVAVMLYASASPANQGLVGPAAVVAFVFPIAALALYVAVIAITHDPAKRPRPGSSVAHRDTAAGALGDSRKEPGDVGTGGGDLGFAGAEAGFGGGDDGDGGGGNGDGGGNGGGGD